MAEAQSTNAATANTEEEKKHDVDYASEETKNAVSKVMRIYPIKRPKIFWNEECRKYQGLKLILFYRFGLV